MTQGDATTGRLVSVNVSTQTGTVKRPVASGVVDAQGIAGDAHAGAWHRQVSLLAEESIARFSSQSGQSFEPGDFAENLTTSGLDLAQGALLDRFVLEGGVELELTQIGKACHGDGCAIYKQVGRCVMPKEGIFCRVLHGGEMCAGQWIRHERRLLQVRVITLSDRASSGVYEDKSGAAALEQLRGFFAGTGWRAEFSQSLLPDDAGQLRDALTAARDGGVDVVVTTGGTGIGPRDITPDVVLALADKVIPGVMELVRVKYGTDKPGALLSRSVAAVLGGMLVYALPGSVRAVNEYLGEIVKTLEHSLYMLHGIDRH